MHGLFSNIFMFSTISASKYAKNELCDVFLCQMTSILRFNVRDFSFIKEIPDYPSMFVKPRRMIIQPIMMFLTKLGVVWSSFLWVCGGGHIPKKNLFDSQYLIQCQRIMSNADYSWNPIYLINKTS